MGSVEATEEVSSKVRVVTTCLEGLRGGIRMIQAMLNPGHRGLVDRMILNEACIRNPASFLQATRPTIYNGCNHR